MKQIFRFFRLFCLFFLLLLIPLNSAYAQLPGEGLTVSPPLFELTINRGETITKTIKLTNPTSKLMEFYPIVMNFRAKGEGGEPAFYSGSDEQTTYSLANWISFRQKKIALMPEQVVEFEYQINVPNNAEPGGHYGVVFFATEPPKPEENISQVAIGSMIGSLILVKIPGTIIEKAQLEEFSGPKLVFTVPNFLKNWLLNSKNEKFKKGAERLNSILFTVRIVNLGNIHFKPKGEIIIKKGNSKEIDKIPVNSIQGNILPDSIRRFDERCATKGSLFGRLSANLNIIYGASEKNLNSTIHFWIIPWWLILIITIAFITVLIIVIKYLKNRKKTKARKSKIQLG